MKNADMNKVLLKAMSDFRDAHQRLLTTIERYENTTMRPVNDIPGFCDAYPFDKSLDELAITEWVDSVEVGLQRVNFQVLDYQYLNTGGNTMVGIHEVWLKDEKRTVYVYTNEEGCTVALVDYIRKEIEVDDFDDVTLDYCDFGRLTGHEKYFELYRRCLNDYNKDDCKYFGIDRGIPFHLLSDELQERVDADYLVWLETNNGCLVPTDGRKIIMLPDYHSAGNDEEALRYIKHWKAWHDTLPSNDRLESMYNEHYSISIAGRRVLIPFDANAFSIIDDLLKSTIEEW